jgi:D-serine dehydratase
MHQQKGFDLDFGLKFVIFQKKVAFFGFGSIIDCLILPCRTGLRREIGWKTAFSVLIMGLTGIAAWSAQASGRARSIPILSGFCDQLMRRQLNGRHWHL